MATKGQKKNNYEANEIFIEYQEKIVMNPIYHGMPDVRLDDGGIQWEAPSNRGAGKFQFTHDKRYTWWKEKADEVGISNTSNFWISKVAKKIHPTGLRPCKVCGRIMEIRYAYLSKNFITRVKKLSYVSDEYYIDEITHVLDFIVSFADKYGDKVFSDFPALFTCKKFPVIPRLGDNIDLWYEWIDKDYIKAEPSPLSPGAMSNAPDRLDGFHSFNRCCRPIADKGRSKENLASYSTDRRAFENWVDGNWLTANKTMGYISSNHKMRKENCANINDGHKHSKPCSADHIGPISLGFIHRPEFQLLCASCNSAKNNRMYLTDVAHLKRIEKDGEAVASWYCKRLWDLLKYKVLNADKATQLTRVMRDNRNIAMLLLNDFSQRKYYLFLLTFLNLEYADFEYEVDNIELDNNIVKSNFTVKKSSLKYVNIQKIRKIKVAFKSLNEYGDKQNRNGLAISNRKHETIKKLAFKLLNDSSNDMKNLNNQLTEIIEKDDILDSTLEEFLNKFDYNKIKNYPNFVKAKNLLQTIMDENADTLAGFWQNARYKRE